MTFENNFINKIEQEKAIAQLKESGKEFVILFGNSMLSVEIYKPHLTDKQSPHDRDEFYMVISGEGKFTLQNLTTSFKPGDFLYVPKFAEHRFIDFSDDFICWVFFIGQK
ncbi:cupin domain-containing protein [Salmonirosea aquatica]|uniref:Cupin domain-containing protein n=1 Tax=Salmonirosea aquatica TaxID=2654236 RepID=A0A7C9BK75_9BACT|nr:cupin domain-containing protein [Cytophagaceae bacterium SJW1-29]